MWNTSLQNRNAEEYTSTQRTLTPRTNYSQTSTSPNSSVHADDCVRVSFSGMEFLPWDNPDNIVSANVERQAREVRNYVLVVLILFGGPANVINMAVFCKQGLKDRVNLCLFSLSLADVVYLLASGLLHGGDFWQEFGPLATFMTNHNLIAFLGCSFVSLVLSAIIACERCFVVLSPLNYHTLLRTRTMAFIVVTAFVLLVGLFYVVSFRYHIACVRDPVLGVVLKTMIATAFYKNHQAFIDILDNVVFGAGLTGTAIVMVVITTIVTTVKLRQAMAWRSETTSSASSSSSLSPREVALTKMLIGSSVLFIVCVSPACVLRVAGLFLPELNAGGRQQNIYFTFLWITDGFLKVNSSINFCVYYRMGSRFRETLWALLCRKDRSEKS